MAKTVRVLAYLLKSAGVDPDKRFDVYFTNLPGKRTVQHSSKLEKFVEDHEFVGARCDMGTHLDEIISQALDGSKPTSIYVLTNGRWNSDRQDSLCGVDGVIARAVSEIQNRGKQRDWLGLQFLRFYGAMTDSDSLGQSRLRRLDDELNLGADIVDTRDWEDDVCSMLTAGVLLEADGYYTPRCP